MHNSPLTYYIHVNVYTLLILYTLGMGAGTIEAVLAVTPMETIKTKLIQTNQGLIPGVRLEQAYTFIYAVLSV